MVKISLPIPYRRDIERYVNRLIHSVKPRTIILYGSLVKGTYRPGSDIDLLVISDNLPHDFLRRLKLLAELDKTMAPIEAIAYTTDEFERMVKSGHLIALESLETGFIIYDDGYSKRLLEIFKRMKEELCLTKVGECWEFASISQGF